MNADVLLVVQGIWGCCANSLPLVDHGIINTSKLTFQNLLGRIQIQGIFGRTFGQFLILIFYGTNHTLLPDDIGTGNY